MISYNYSRHATENIIAYTLNCKKHTSTNMLANMQCPFLTLQHLISAKRLRSSLSPFSSSNFRRSQWSLLSEVTTKALIVLKNKVSFTAVKNTIKYLTTISLMFCFLVIPRFIPFFFSFPCVFQDSTDDGFRYKYY